MKLSRIDCITCKGRFCKNYQECPIYSRARVLFKSNNIASKDITGQSPAPFVGHYGYPKVSVGILAPPEKVDNPEMYDAPLAWADKDLQIPEIVKFRASLVNSRFPAYVKDRNNKMLEISKEVGMASKPVDIEINLEKAPSFRWSFDLETAPLGPAGKLKHASITSNPFVSRSVEKAVEDTDWKANEALVYLHKKGFDENFLMRLFSVGNLGIQEKRKLVPTRWSITATDDILGKDAINRVKNYSNYVNYSAFFGSYLGNYYLILLFPEPWSYELFETYTPSQRWTVQPTKYSTDYENTSGRKNYAEQTAGGYYTTRLIAAEYMDSVRKQGACLAIRLITDEYAVPLGVWVTREASRKAMNKDPIEFSSKELMLKYAYEKIKKQFGYDATNIINNSLLLKELKEQRRLGSYF